MVNSGTRVDHAICQASKKIRLETAPYAQDLKKMGSRETKKEKKDAKRHN